MRSRSSPATRATLRDRCGVLALIVASACTDPESGRATDGATDGDGSNDADGAPRDVDRADAFVPDHADPDASDDRTPDASGDSDTDACVPMSCEELGLDCGGADLACGVRTSCGVCAASCVGNHCQCLDATDPGDDSIPFASRVDAAGGMANLRGSIWRREDVDWTRISLLTSPYELDITVESPDGADLRMRVVQPNPPCSVACTSFTGLPTETDAGDGYLGCELASSSGTVHVSSGCGDFLIGIDVGTRSAWSGQCGVYTLTVSQPPM